MSSSPMRVAAVLAAVASACAGCGSASSSSTESTPGTSPRLVSYARSGGLAYSNITLVVDSEGHGVATSTGPTGKRTQKVALPPSRVERINKLLDAAPLADLPKHMQLGCADCYRYVLAYGGDHYATDEASVPSTLKPVIATLDPIAARAIPPNLAPSLSG